VSLPEPEGIGVLKDELDLSDAGAEEADAVESVAPLDSVRVESTVLDPDNTLVDPGSSGGFFDDDTGVCAGVVGVIGVVVEVS